MNISLSILGIPSRTTPVYVRETPPRPERVQLNIQLTLVGTWEFLNRRHYQNEFAILNIGRH